MTLDEFRDHLAENMGIKGDGNVLSADRANYLTRIITHSQGELEQLEVALWPASDIPDYAIEGFALFCESKVTRFGRNADPALERYALAKLRFLTADSRNGVGKAEYF